MRCHTPQALTHSERALEWLMENLVDDGDEVVAVRVLDFERTGASCVRTVLTRRARARFCAGSRTEPALVHR